MSTLEAVLVLIDRLSSEEQHQLKTYLDQREQMTDPESPAHVVTDFKIAWQEMKTGDVLSVDELWAYLDADHD